MKIFEDHAFSFNSDLEYGGLFIMKTNNLPKDWKQKIEKMNLSTRPEEALPILQELVDRKDKEGIRWFHEHICTNTLDRSDRDSFYHNFLAWFTNMKEVDAVEANREPKTGKHYLCFRCIYHRGDIDEFFVDVFFQKKEIFETPYKYHQFLLYNNLVGFETFLHTCEFDEPILSEENMVQCNNIVLNFRWKGTEYEKHLNPCIYLYWNWYDEVKEKFEELGLNFRHVLSNGEDLIVVLDLYRTLNMKNQQLRYILNKVEEKLHSELKDFYVYDNKNFFMVPGSMNYHCKNGRIKNHNIMYFACREMQNGYLMDGEFSYRRCYMLGNDCFQTGTVSLTSLANFFQMEKAEQKNLHTKTHQNNYVRFKKVGEERLKDFDTLLLYRNFDMGELSFQYMSLIANVMCYLNKTENEILLYLQKKNALLKKPLAYEQLLKILEFNLKNIELYKSNPNLGIKYSNDAIVNKLSITDDEQDEMFQLISKEMAKLRTRYQKREYAKKKYEEKKSENKKKKEAFKEEVNKLYKKGMTIKEIANKTEKDVRTVKKVLEYAEEELIFKVKVMLAQGKSITDVSKELHMSRKRVAKMKNEEAVKLPPSYDTHIRHTEESTSDMSDYTTNDSENCKNDVCNQNTHCNSRQTLNYSSDNSSYNCKPYIDEYRQTKMSMVEYCCATEQYSCKHIKNTICQKE